MAKVRAREPHHDSWEGLDGGIQLGAQRVLYEQVNQVGGNWVHVGSGHCGGVGGGGVEEDVEWVRDGGR